MKRFIFYAALSFQAFILSSCQLQDIDNYDGPNATINGGLYDYETGELVQQDIINGTQIEFIEHGFNDPQIQYMVVKNDGSYRNNLMFSGEYTIRPVRGNFVPVEPEVIQVDHTTIKNFRVQPYIRIKDASIVKEDNKIIATFRMDQTVTNRVTRIALFSHTEPNVGAALTRVTSGINLNAVSNDVQLYRVEINLNAYSGILVEGREYYFRIGAIIDAPESKYNYAPAVRIKI